jgi:outer membrane protein assembly factor BamD (BamD/ComL family)
LAAFNLVISRDKEGKFALDAAYRAGIMLKNREKFDDAIKYFSIAKERYRPNKGFNDYYAQDSQFQMMDCAYLAQNYQLAGQYASTALKTNPKMPQATWAQYVKGFSEAKLNQDAKALESLKELAKKEEPSVYKKAANASLDFDDWREKHDNLYQ